MKPRRSQATNHTIRLAGGTPANDLPVRVDVIDVDDMRPGQPLTRIRSVWALDPTERAAIATGRANVELTVHGNMHPPVSLGITRDQTLPVNPDEPAPPDADAVTMWLELGAELASDLLTVLDELDENAVRTPHDRRRLAALIYLRERVREYLPCLAPIPDDDESPSP